MYDIAKEIMIAIRNSSLVVPETVEVDLRVYGGMCRLEVMDGDNCDEKAILLWR